MDIYITEKSGKREIRIPWLPTVISFSSGGTRFMTYDILDKGEVAIPNGENLRAFRWDSVLPGEGRKGLPFLKGDWQDPKAYQTIWSEWKVNGTPLRLLITGTPINHDVYLSDYEVSYSGGFGDYSYSIEFRDKRDIVISSTQVEKKTTTTKRPETVTSQKTHKVVNGDCLWSIASKYLKSGNRWREIYRLNKEVIENECKRRGLKCSENGHWIFAGTILKIPS